MNWIDNHNIYNVLRKGEDKMEKKNIKALHGIIAELENGKTISEALSVYYTKRKVLMPIKENVRERNLDAIEFSARMNNALKRQHLFTFGDIYDYIENGNKLSDIKNVGLVSMKDFCEKMLNYHFDLLSADEKVNFLVTFVEENKESLRK